MIDRDDGGESQNDLTPYFNCLLFRELKENLGEVKILPPDYAVSETIGTKSLGEDWGRKISRKVNWIILGAKFFLPQKRLLTISLDRSLGARLYQVATVLATASRQKLVPVFNLTKEHCHRGSVFRNLQWFDIEEMKFQAYAPEQFTYEEIPEFPGMKDVILVGAYQSFKWFRDKRDLVLETLIPQNYLEYSSSAFRELVPEGAIAISVNLRQSLENEKIRDWLEFPLITWYIKALQLMKDKLGENWGKVIILGFTDDVDAFRESFVKAVEADLEISAERIICCSNMGWDEEFGDADVVDLLVAAHCPYHVLTNEVICPWIPFLGERKLTVVPKEWFGPKAIEKGIVTDDIWEEDWIKL